ncbi:MAG: ATP-binding protein [Gammaproteobacteria bacterium]
MPTPPHLPGESDHAAYAADPEHLQRLLDACGIVPWHVDHRHGNAARFGAAVEQLTGFPSAEFERNPWLWGSLIHPDDLPDVEAALAALDRLGRYRAEFRCRTATGAWRWLETEAVMIAVGTDGAREMRGFVRDITPRKTLEAALQDANVVLERRVHERTAELEQARFDAEAANRSKDRFLSHMSHELRTPMNAVLGFARLLLLDGDNPLNADQRESVQEIVTAGEHLLGLLNEVLDLARIEAGKLELTLGTVLVTPLVDDCLALLQVELAAHGITVRHQPVPGEPVKVEADPRRLRQVLLNLLSNAVKYGHDGGTITVRSRADTDARVRIEIIDEGAGIAPEQCARLFEPFARLASHDGIPGTGLGLVLARQLVEAMHGSLGVDSVPGRGSTFYVCLPAAAAVPRMPRPAGD